MEGRNHAYLDLVATERRWWHLDCVPDNGELKHPACWEVRGRWCERCVEVEWMGNGGGGEAGGRAYLEARTTPPHFFYA